MYWLIIICQTLAIGDICLFQISDEWEKNEVHPVVWVSRPTVGAEGSVVSFGWTGKLSVACRSATRRSSEKTLPVVMDSVFIAMAADPKERGKKAFLLSYNKGRSAYQLMQESADLDDRTSVVLRTDWNFPLFP
ncbi:MAG: hypothetical protein LBH75_00205, partial [Treponema sp.]|nr:hypothetical protein [Treponema sp.]